MLNLHLVDLGVASVGLDLEGHLDWLLFVHVTLQDAQKLVEFDLLLASENGL